MKSAHEIVKILRIETLAKITVSLFKIIIWLGVAIGSLLALALLASTIINLIQGRELRQTLNQLKAEGHPLTIAEIKPAPVPDDQNAATILKQLPGFYPTSSKNFLWPEIYNLVKLIYANSNNVDIAAWQATDREKLLLQIKNKVVEKYLNVFAEASKKPFLNFNIYYENGPLANIPNSGDFGNYAYIMSIKAVLDAQAGNNEAAFEKVLEAYKISSLITQEPSIFCQLASMRLDIDLKDCLELISDISNVPSDKATAIIKELACHADLKPWIRTMDAERVCNVLWLYDRIKQEGFIPASIEIKPQFNYYYRFCNYLRFNFFWKNNVIIYLQIISKMQENYSMPYYEVIRAGRLYIGYQELAKYPTIYIILPRMPFLFMDSVVRTKAKHDANIALTQIGLALKLYKQKNAAYPDNLEKIAPDFIAKVPNDPCSGKVLIYRKEGEGFVLYSVGPDLKDDNGTPLPYKADETKTPYDIVWKSRK